MTDDLNSSQRQTATASSVAVAIIAGSGTAVVAKNATISRFVDALPGDVLTRLTDANLQKDQRNLQKRRAKQAQARLFG